MKNKRLNTISSISNKINKDEIIIINKNENKNDKINNCIFMSSIN